ncbi:MAG: hypothetical protein LBJ11_11550 [Oscillospiraceae bacterium]|nr:hypothetical protein [Oscillospiraceae bacterium]
MCLFRLKRKKSIEKEGVSMDAIEVNPAAVETSPMEPTSRWTTGKQGYQIMPTPTARKLPDKPNQLKQPAEPLILKDEWKLREMEAKIDVLATELAEAKRQAAELKKKNKALTARIAKLEKQSVILAPSKEDEEEARFAAKMEETVRQLEERLANGTVTDEDRAKSRENLQAIGVMDENGEFAYPFNLLFQEEE